MKKVEKCQFCGRELTLWRREYSNGVETTYLTCPNCDYIIESAKKEAGQDGKGKMKWHYMICLDCAEAYHGKYRHCPKCGAKLRRWKTCSGESIWLKMGKGSK